MANGRQTKADVLPGTLDLMVLTKPGHAGGIHGYAVAARFEQVSHGALRLNMGTLYPALMRLEQHGAPRGAWGTTDGHRKARFYTLTAAGRRQLTNARKAWDRMATILHSLLHGEA